ncbi:hypothetical protein OC842_005913 [Tilletia horrida]|uniref:Uncharacterized protein n=1 Tax=Tilletia horrida TaxID=155126 RepID=A0AAN6JI18_9BASI|nr:hypothetical protein OC842_005913 [Tilletia horrida]
MLGGSDSETFKRKGLTGLLKTLLGGSKTFGKRPNPTVLLAIKHRMDDVGMGDEDQVERPDAGADGRAGVDREFRGGDCTAIPMRLATRAQCLKNVLHRLNGALHRIGLVMVRQ